MSLVYYETVWRDVVDRLLEVGHLTEAQRQTVTDYREAIQELRRDPERGFEKLDQIGAIREVGWGDRARAVARAYAESPSQGRHALVVCATHDEIDRVTEAIRSNRKQAGDLGESVPVARDISLNWTTAQKSDVRNFRAGHRPGFHRAVTGIAKNETLIRSRRVSASIVSREKRKGETGLTVASSRRSEALSSIDLQVPSMTPAETLVPGDSTSPTTFSLAVRRVELSRRSQEQ
jgi:hypothetical protein